MKIHMRFVFRNSSAASFIVNGLLYYQRKIQWNFKVQNTFFFVSNEFYDNQHEHSHAVRGCGACLGIRAWRRLL